ISRLGDAFFLGTEPLDSIQETFLDRQGNANDLYDLGDLRAWVLANPGLPLGAQLQRKERAIPSSPRVITLPVRLEKPEDPR
ncbi:MAG: hypothetical protein PVI31_00005, partial [Gemmatimonadota bacterium]